MPVRQVVQGGDGRKASERLDTFVDTSFGFAVTLLVISGGAMPQTGPQLAAALLHIPAFLLSFAMIARLWLSHRSWSARYALQDGMSTILSLLLVALVLIFVFPLHAMFEALVYVASGKVLPSRFQIESLSDLRIMYLAFASMFVCFGIVFAAMHIRAWELRASGDYGDDLARAAAGLSVGFIWMASIGLASMVLTMELIRPGLTGWETMAPPTLYGLLFLTGPLSRLVASRLGTKS